MLLLKLDLCKWTWSVITLNYIWIDWAGLYSFFLSMVSHDVWVLPRCVFNKAAIALAQTFENMCIPYRSSVKLWLVNASSLVWSNIVLACDLVMRMSCGMLLVPGTAWHGTSPAVGHSCLPCFGPARHKKKALNAVLRPRGRHDNTVRHGMMKASCLIVSCFLVLGPG